MEPLRWSVVPTVAYLVTDQWTLDTSLCIVAPLHQVCHLLSAEPVPCGWEGISHGVPTWRPGLDVDTHMSHLTSESRYPGAGSLPQSSTSSWYSSHHFSGSQICRTAVGFLLAVRISFTEIGWPSSSVSIVAVLESISQMNALLYGL